MGLGFFSHYLLLDFYQKACHVTKAQYLFGKQGKLGRRIKELHLGTHCHVRINYTLLLMYGSHPHSIKIPEFPYL